MQQYLPLKSEPISWWPNALLVIGTTAALVWLERLYPLRSYTEAPLKHDARNFVLAIMSGLSKKATEKLLTDRLIQYFTKRKYGLLHISSLPPPVKQLLAFALLDYSVYVGHRLAHKWHFLWRFHQIHHFDLDLTTSTGLRIHIGEAIISSLFRSLQIAAIGTPLRDFRIWQTFSQLAILFHHSNLKLPFHLEQRLIIAVVTPQMHAIHHSMVWDETNSNWSSGLTFWDWLHNTLILAVPQQDIAIGVPAFSVPERVGLPRLLIFPITRKA